MTIRTATVADADRLAAFAELTFREAFGAMNTPEDMELHCRRSYSAAKQAEEIAATDSMTLLCEVDGMLAGYTQLRWGAKVPACVIGSAVGEIQRFYVHSPHHGTGVATALMTAAVSQLAERGCRNAWLSVWEQNPRAIAFYRKCGFIEVGKQIFLVGNDPQNDKVLVKVLSTV